MRRPTVLDPLDDLHQVPIVFENKCPSARAVRCVHVHLVESVDEDVGDGGIAQQPFERAQAEELVQNVVDERFAFVLRVVSCRAR
jgi:hypothetical protein